MEKNLPKNWTLANLPKLISPDGIFTDGDWVESKDQDPNGDVRLIQLADIGVNDFRDKSNRFLTSKSAQALKCTFIKKNDVMIARMPDPIGRACIFPLEGKYVTVVDVAFIRVNEKYISNKILMYFINSPQFNLYIQNLASGSTRKRISRKNLSTIDFPLPPLKEQQRIAVKLDTLFTHLEALKTRLTNIPQILKNFRQAILTQAVTGKLTQEWRKGKELEEWEEGELGKIGKWKGGGTPSKAIKKYWENGDVLWITPKDMKGLIIVDSKDKITKESVENSSANYIDANSILMVTRSGILRRILPISMNSKIATVNQDIKVLTLKNNFNPKFILYVLRGLEENIRTTCMKSGTTVESVEFLALKKYIIKFPKKEEQTEIVKRVEYLFSKSDAIEAQYQSLKTKIDSLPQAILAKAFKGELVAQLDTDGDAKELLAEIQKLKTSMRGTK